MSSHPSRDISLSENSGPIAMDTDGLSDEPGIEPKDPKDVEALTLAISEMIEGIVRKVVEIRLASLLPPLIEQSVKNLLPDSVVSVVTAQLPRLVDEPIRALLPGLVESALASQHEALKESIEGATRDALPALIDPIVERLAADTLQSEVQKLLKTSGLEVIEKIAWEIVPSQAEIEVKKEIERLTADA